MLTRSRMTLGFCMFVVMAAAVWVFFLQIPPISPIPGTPATNATATAVSTPSWQPQSPISRTVQTDLASRRYIAAGDRAYVIGTTDGAFPPMGWHIPGEMGGIWAQPIKLFDGYWFALDGKWLPAAESFTSAAGYVRIDYPQQGTLAISRIEFAPDNVPAVLVGLIVTNNGTEAASKLVSVDMVSDIMAAYPYSWSSPENAEQANKSDNMDLGRSSPLVHNPLQFQEEGKDWFAMAATSAPEATNELGRFMGPVDSDPLGKRASGRFSWRAELAPGEQQIYWLALAGSYRSHQEAEQALSTALADPMRLLDDKVAARAALLQQSQLIVSNPVVQAAADWSKLNLDELRQVIPAMAVRDVDEGKLYPTPAAELTGLSGIAAGLPDYPNYKATDAAFSTYALLASSQVDTAKSQLRLIRDASRAVNGKSGKVVSEIGTDGSIYYGTNSDPGNGNTTAQFANAVDLVWRWSGDNSFRDEMYEFVRDGMSTLTTATDRNRNGCPDGPGLAPNTGATENIDVTAYTWQGLVALEHMAEGRNDEETGTWAHDQAATLQSTFDTRWWLTSSGSYASGTTDCARPDGMIAGRLWTELTPLEVGLAPLAHANEQLTQLESGQFSGADGLYSSPDEKRAGALPTGLMALAEANYGRLGDKQAPRFIEALAALLDQEMPGALPESAASQSVAATVGNNRSAFISANATFGIQWPLINNVLGIVPDMPDGAVRVVPQLPSSWPSIRVRNLRLGGSDLDAGVIRAGQNYTVTVSATTNWKLVIGYTLPTGVVPATVTLDGKQAEWTAVDTMRGTEVLVETDSGSERVLVVSVK